MHYLGATFMNLIIAIQRVIRRLHHNIILFVSLLDILYHTLLEKLVASDLVGFHKLLVAKRW
jgi:hypothetical protein